jgi:hypothetical protein
VQVWVPDVEALEAVTQDKLVRRIVLRMAGLPCGGPLPVFGAAVGSDAELDAETKATVLELVRDKALLLAARESMRATTYGARAAATIRPLGRLAQLVRAPL